jgi:hypothetical protein
MKRLPLAAVGGLAAATVASFFITQHLKVTTPLITGPQGGLATYGDTPHLIYPGSIPGDPTCPTSTTAYFHLLHRADSVQVTITDSRRKIIRTIANDIRAAIYQPLHFTWNFREANGQPAPPGTYNFRVRLLHQNRTIDPLIPNFPISISRACSGS